MNLQHFENEIDSVIVDRGKSYFDSGSVCDLEEISPSRWSAQVIGTELYDVMIWFKGDEIREWDCDCPYDWGPVCKHVVAVLYAIVEVKQKDKASAVRSGKTKKVKKKTKEEQLQKIIAKVSQDELRGFVETYALNHHQFLSEILVRFSEFIDLGGKSKYKQIIKNIVRSGKGRDGFIDYQASFSVMKQVDNLLGKANEYYHEGNYQESINICQTVIEEIPLIVHEMDDSAGGATFSFQTACDIVGEIISEVESSTVRDVLFHFCMEEYPKEKYHDFGFEGCFLHFLSDLIDDTEKEAAFVGLLDEELKKALEEDSDFRFVDILRHKIHFYQNTGREAEARHLIEQNIEFPEFRNILVEEAIKQEEHQKAIALAMEGLDIAAKKGYSGDVHAWKDKLLTIAERKNDKEEIRRWAEDLFFSRTNAMEYYSRLKKTYSKTEWKEQVEKIIQKISRSNTRFRYHVVLLLGDIYVEENFKDRLLKLLQETERDLHFLDRYSSYLEADFPDEILGLYRESVEQHALHTGRNIYHEVVKYLKRMQKIQGGDEVVRGMVQGFRQKYKNRPAMMEILNRSL